MVMMSTEVQFCGTCTKLIRARTTVQQTVVSVDVQMNKIWNGFHADPYGEGNRFLMGRLNRVALIIAREGTKVHKEKPNRVLRVSLRYGFSQKLNIIKGP